MKYEPEDEENNMHLPSYLKDSYFLWRTVSYLSGILTLQLNQCCSLICSTHTGFSVKTRKIPYCYSIVILKFLLSYHHHHHQNHHHYSSNHECPEILRQPTHLISTNSFNSSVCSQLTLTRLIHDYYVSDIWLLSQQTLWNTYSKSLKWSWFKEELFSRG